MDSTVHTIISVLTVFVAYVYGNYVGINKGFDRGIEVSMQTLVNLGIIASYDVEIRDDEEEDEG